MKNQSERSESERRESESESESSEIERKESESERSESKCTKVSQASLCSRHDSYLAKEQEPEDQSMMGRFIRVERQVRISTLRNGQNTNPSYKQLSSRGNKPPDRELEA